MKVEVNIYAVKEIDEH